MSISNFARLARIAIRTEVLAVEARAGQAMRRFLLIVFGTLLICAGLILLHVGAYEALTALWGPAWAPVALGLFDVALGVNALLFAAMLKPSPGLAVADELRKLTAEQLVTEVKTMPFMSNTSGSFRSATLNRLIMRSIALALGRLLRRRTQESRKPEDMTAPDDTLTG